MAPLVTMLRCLSFNYLLAACTLCLHGRIFVSACNGHVPSDSENNPTPSSTPNLTPPPTSTPTSASNSTSPPISTSTVTSASTSTLITTSTSTPTSRPVPSDCLDVYNQGFFDSGVYTIEPTDWPGSPFQVYCNMTDGGGWTVFQRRVNGSEDFNIGWKGYKDGFGSPNHELWLGNDKIFYLTRQRNYELRVDLVARNRLPYYVKYDLFRISDENDYYRLELGSYLDNGALGFDYFNWHESNQFSTYDIDNDGWNLYNCAQMHRGGWWHGKGIADIFDTDLCSNANYESYCNLWPLGDNCGWCSYVNLNGDYNSTTRGTNIFWNNLVAWDCNLVYTEMKLRPI